MLSGLEMNSWLDAFWQFNLDLTVIVLTVLIARFFIRKTTKSYNSYLLWLAIPLGFVVAKIISSMDFSSANSDYIGQAVSVMIAKPVETLQNYWWLGTIWLSGTTLLLLRLIVQHIELRKDLKIIERPINELPGFNLISKSRYQVIAVDHKEMSPAVYGFIKPTIYFPIHVAKQLSVQQIQLIIEHEEQHIKQKHLWLNLLWDILVCIGWFNPLIYIARKNFRHDQELFCDYLVLNKGNDTRTKDYGHALLSTVSATHSVSLLCSWKVFNQLEERIMNITDPLNKTRKIVMTIGAAFVLSCCAVYAANKEAKEENIVTNEEIAIDENGNKRVVLEFSEGDGKTYLQENDKFFVVEKGTKRPMTEVERKEFEKKHEEAELHLKATERELILVEKELENAHRVLMLNDEELANVDIEIERIHETLEEAHKTIEMEYEQGKISKEEMEQARADLENKHKEMIIKNYDTKNIDGNSKVITIDERHFVDASGAKRHVIKYEDNSGKTYTVQDGQYFIEENGNQRAMTPEEKAQFEKDIRVLPPKPEQPPQPKSPKPADAATYAKPFQYPKVAVEQGIEGHVVFRFDVDKDGKPTNIEVYDSVPEGVFEQDALNAFKEWEFAQHKQTQNLKYQLDFKLQ